MTTTNKRHSKEVRERSVRTVLEHQDKYASQWAAMVSVAGKIDRILQTLNALAR